ncbi:hypothetical protein H1C71_005586, partial [Ictidomys tridecemlineatus]
RTQLQLLTGRLPLVRDIRPFSVPAPPSRFQPCRSQRQSWQKTAGNVAERVFENENEHLFRENEDKSFAGGEEKDAWLTLGVLSNVAPAPNLQALFKYSKMPECLESPP